jgi:putative hydrolase of the HAD superfamily
MRPIKAVGFDFDHTLGLDHALEATAFAELARELGSPIALANEPWSGLVPRLLTRFRAGELSVEDAVGIFLRDLGRSDDPVDHAERWRELCYDLVPAHVRPVDGARETIAALCRAGIPVAIFTNGWSPLQEKKIAQALGDFPGPVLVSETLGVSKPDGAAFARLADALGAPESAIAYVGDNPRVDADGARSAGMLGIWFDWEGTPHPADLAPAQETIHHLSELLALVPPGRGAGTENLIS